MLNLDLISSDDKNKEGDFTLIKGSSDPSIQGNIYRTSTGELISSSFQESSVVEFSTDKDFVTLFTENTYATIGYEGAMVKLQYSENQTFFSNTSRVDCRNSFWGIKEHTFYKLWYENGGEKFINSIEHSNLTHHFMIMNSNLVITSRMDLRDHDTVIIYLGSVDLEGNILQLDKIDPEIYYLYTDRSNVLPSKEELAGRILIPTVITGDEALAILKNGYEQISYKEDTVPFSLFKGETVILRRGTKEIVKVTPMCYDMRKKIAGNTPNIKNGGFLVDVEITEKKMTKFLEERKDLFEKLADMYIEKMKTSGTVKN